MTRAWHYTSALHWPLIEAAGFLKTTETNLSALETHAGPAAVWLLDGPELGGAEHGLYPGDPRFADKTQVRIEVDPPWRLLPWVGWARAQGIELSWYETMVRLGGGQEAADRWLLSFRRIPREHWVRAENLKTGEELWKR